MYATSHVPMRTARRHVVDEHGHRHTVRYDRPGRPVARRAAIAEQTGVRR